MPKMTVRERLIAALLARGFVHNKARSSHAHDVFFAVPHTRCLGACRIGNNVYIGRLNSLRAGPTLAKSAPAEKSKAILLDEVPGYSADIPLSTLLAQDRPNVPFPHS